MRIIIYIILIMVTISGCASMFNGVKDKKSPCVATESLDGSPTPCIRRNANDHWLG